MDYKVRTYCPRVDPSRTGLPLLSLYSGEDAYKGRNPRGIFDDLSYFIKLLWLQ
jgi:hypothetical protein